MFSRLLTFAFLLLTLFARSVGAQPPPQDQASAIATIVQKAMKTEHLRAVIVKVTQGDKVVISRAFGESMTGVPATTAMHFRNGAVAFEYLGTLLMQFVDEHKVKLDDTIERWMPDLPQANKVTLKMLTNQTSGYPDFETDPGWTAAFSVEALPRADCRARRHSALATSFISCANSDPSIRPEQSHDLLLPNPGGSASHRQVSLTPDPARKP
jgi:CubicO group peptidase (beta-lactamase class C family)